MAERSGEVEFRIVGLPAEDFCSLPPFRASRSTWERICIVHFFWDDPLGALELLLV